jgi:branched-chain amino acid transport system permease protein
MSASIRLVLVLVAVIALGFLLPHAISSTLVMTLLAQALISAILATSVGFLVRQSGLVTFGHAAFFGLAAYTVALLVKHAIVPPGIALLLAIAIPTAVAFLLGLVLVRIPGVAFSMITLAIGQVLYEIVFKWRALANGDDGLAIRFPAELLGFSTRALQRPETMFVVAWTMLALVIFGLHLVSRSHLGRLSEAIRDNEERARFIGYRTVLPAALVYAISAGVAAIAGVLFALYNAFVSPENLHWSLSGSALVMAIIGGTRLLVGPLIGALVLFVAKDLLGDVTEHWQGFVGLLLIAVTLWMPKGIGGAVLARLRRTAPAEGAAR